MVPARIYIARVLTEPTGQRIHRGARQQVHPRAAPVHDAVGLYGRREFVRHGSVSGVGAVLVRRHAVGQHSGGGHGSVCVLDHEPFAGHVFRHESAVQATERGGHRVPGRELVQQHSGVAHRPLRVLPHRPYDQRASVSRGRVRDIQDAARLHFGQRESGGVHPVLPGGGARAHVRQRVQPGAHRAQHDLHERGHADAASDQRVVGQVSCSSRRAPPSQSPCSPRRRSAPPTSRPPCGSA